MADPKAEAHEIARNLVGLKIARARRSHGAMFLIDFGDLDEDAGRCEMWLLVESGLWSLDCGSNESAADESALSDEDIDSALNCLVGETVIRVLPDDAGRLELRTKRCRLVVLPGAGPLDNWTLSSGDRIAYSAIDGRLCSERNSSK